MPTSEKQKWFCRVAPNEGLLSFVRKILRLEEQLETMPHGPAKQVVLDDYLKAYDELAEGMARE